MSKSIRNTLALVLLALLLVTCAPAVQDSESTQVMFGDFEIVATTGGFGNVYRFIDAKADVVCWIHQTRGGISCLPLSDTALEPPR